MKRTYETRSDRRRQGQTDNDRQRQIPTDSDIVHRQSTDADRHRQGPQTANGRRQGPQTVNRVHRRRQTRSVDELGVSPVGSCVAFIADSVIFFRKFSVILYRICFYSCVFTVLTLYPDCCGTIYFNGGPSAHKVICSTPGRIIYVPTYFLVLI